MAKQKTPVEREMESTGVPIVRAILFESSGSGSGGFARYVVVELEIQGNRVLDRRVLSDGPEGQQFAFARWMDEAAIRANEVIDGTN